MQQAKIENLMTKDVVCVHPDTKVEELVHTMSSNRHSCVVVAEDKVPLGIITERDIVRLLASVVDRTALAKQRSADFMTSPLVTVDTQDTLFNAMVITRAEKLRHLPVTDSQGNLQGIITHSDLVQAHFHIFEKQRGVLERSVEEHKNLIKANEKLRALSLQDALLGIGNRRAMEVDLHHTHSLTLRHQRLYSTVLFDVDYFKLYNDYYGHPAGDRSLKKITLHLSDCMRKSDRLYRYGGEEVLMLLPETSLGEAKTLSQRMLIGLADLAIPHCKSPYKVITLSGGIGCGVWKNKVKKTWKDVIAKADRGLYQSKNMGRNKLTSENEIVPIDPL